VPVNGWRGQPQG